MTNDRANAAKTGKRFAHVPNESNRITLNAICGTGEHIVYSATASYNSTNARVAHEKLVQKLLDDTMDIRARAIKYNVQKVPSNK